MSVTSEKLDRLSEEATEASEEIATWVANNGFGHGIPKWNRFNDANIAWAREVKDLYEEALTASRAENEALRAALREIAGTEWQEDEPNSREDLGEDWGAYIAELEAFSNWAVETAIAALAREVAP